MVRETCRAWMENTTKGRSSVRIRLDKLVELAEEISAQKASANTNKEDSSWIEWDEEGWHYNGDGFEGTRTEKRERVALYLLALDAINFCFWPLPETSNTNDEDANSSVTNLLEYEHLAMAMKKMAEADHGKNGIGYVFSPQNLASMDVDKMTSLFESCLDPKKYPLPNIRKRASLWKEVGEILLEKFEGSASALLEAADGDAPKLVELIATSFPGFRDEVHTKTTQRIVFLKRAQIFVGDINAALNLQLRRMDKLTTFADYRVPQILRHKGALEYAPYLGSIVDRYQEIQQNSFDEISIRAATVVAVEKLVEFLNQKSSDAFTDVTVDWYLWQVGERMNQEGTMKPFHRVRTQFY